jgi:hypothetical protein
MEDADVSSIVPMLLKVIEWGLVPLVLVILWFYAFFLLPEEGPTAEAKTAARHARWAALVIFVLFVISRKGAPDTLTLNIPNYDFHWLLTLSGMVLGFFASLIISFLRYLRVISLVVLVLVASMSIALYSYFFVLDARVGILFLALGFALGTLLDKAFGRLRPHIEDKEEA